MTEAYNHNIKPLKFVLYVAEVKADLGLADKHLFNRAEPWQEDYRRAIEVLPSHSSYDAPVLFSPLVMTVKQGETLRARIAIANKMLQTRKEPLFYLDGYLVYRHAAEIAYFPGQSPQPVLIDDMEMMRTALMGQQKRKIDSKISEIAKQKRKDKKDKIRELGLEKTMIDEFQDKLLPERRWEIARGMYTMDVEQMIIATINKKSK